MFPVIPLIIDLVTDTASSIGATVAQDVFRWLSSMLLTGIGWLFGVVWGFISQATTADLYASWFAGGVFGLMTRFAIAILMLTVMLAIAETIWNCDGAGLMRSMLQDFPKALGWLTGLLAVTTLGLEIADALTAGLLGFFDGGVTQFTDRLSAVADRGSFGGGLIVVIVMSLVMMLVLLFVALELIFRQGFIYVLTALCAIAVVVDVYRPTRGSAARSGRLLAGVIAAKPLIALCFAIGGTALGAGVTGNATVAAPEPGTPTDVVGVSPDAGAGSGDLAPTVGVLLAGFATLSLAAVAPFTVLKLFPVADAAATAGARAQVTSSVTGAATTAASMAAGAVGGGGGGAAAAGGGGAGGAGAAGKAGAP